MKTSTLNKLSPEAREQVISIEGRLREIQEEKAFINRILKQQEIFI